MLYTYKIQRFLHTTLTRLFHHDVSLHTTLPSTHNIAVYISPRRIARRPPPAAPAPSAAPPAPAPPPRCCPASRSTPARPPSHVPRHTSPIDNQPSWASSGPAGSCLLPRCTLAACTRTQGHPSVMAGPCRGRPAARSHTRQGGSTRACCAAGLAEETAREAAGAGARISLTQRSGCGLERLRPGSMCLGRLVASAAGRCGVSMPGPRPAAGG